MTKQESPPIIDVPVIIIGGGGCGLNLSIFLSNYGIEHYLFEKHPGTSLLPKAHYLNQRVAEIWRQHGIIDAIKQDGCPIENMSQIDWRTSLGGDEVWDRRIIASLPSFGGKGCSNAYARDGPELSTNMPLIRSEPIFRRLAEGRNPGRILFAHKVVDFEDNGDSVLVDVHNFESGVQRFRAQYVVGADGGKYVGPKIGVQMEGPTNLVDMVGVHFKADLSEYADDRTIITHFINPEGVKMAHLDSGALVKMGPTWTRHSEEWNLIFGFSLTDNNRFNKEDLPPRIRQLLKLPDLQMEVLHVSHWVIERVVATKYSNSGRVFIAGDACHKRPPTTGLGLNTSIQDSHNIAWKLASVLQGKAHRSLLKTYETERRPIGVQTADWGLFTFSNFQVLQSAVGLIPGQKEYNQMRFTRLFEKSEYGGTMRHQLNRLIATQDIEFQAHGIEMDIRYEENAATVTDGTPAPARDPLGKTYIATTRPGHRLPHAWIESKGETVSTHDLVGMDDFLLITDEAGGTWREAARQLSQSRCLKIRAVGIKSRRHVPAAGEIYVDKDDQWAESRGINDGGAILIRPDNVVAWRSREPSKNGGKDLAEAIESILGQRF